MSVTKLKEVRREGTNGESYAAAYVVFEGTEHVFITKSWDTVVDYRAFVRFEESATQDLEDMFEANEEEGFLATLEELRWSMAENGFVYEIDPTTGEIPWQATKKAPRGGKS